MTNKFNVGDKVVCIRNYHDFTEGKEYKIHHADEQTIILIDDVVEQNQWSVDGFEKYFKVVPTKNQRITALEETVAKQGEEINELKLIVAQIRKPSTVVEEALANDIIEFEGKQYKKVDREAREGDVVIFRENTYYGLKNNRPYAVNTCTRTGMAAVEGSTRLYLPSYGRSKDNIDVYELIVEDKLPPTITVAGETREITHEEIAELISEPKTANQLRAEIIEKAKGFVESQFKKHWNGSGNLVIARGLGLYSCEFLVNEEKRSVVVLLRLYKYKRVQLKGIAKCDPSDVFNEHIGKAIALGRALGLDVSEFEQAVHPTVPVVGTIVNYHSEKRIAEVMPEYSKMIDIDTQTYLSTALSEPLDTTIINDTNAQYGGVE